MGKAFGNRDDLADFLFTTRRVTFGGKTVPGLGLNIVRYNAGASGESTIGGRKMIASKAIKKSRQIDAFWLDGKSPDPQSASWDWNADASQRALLLKARARGVNHFELFSNSPPWWMCANDNPSGAARATDDNLPAKNYPAFATYLATIAGIARDRWGIRFDSIEPFNEPMTSWWSARGTQEGCHFSRAAQAAFLPILRAELDRQGLQTLPIAASDETNFDSALATWKSFSPETKAIVSQVNVHDYQYARGQRAALYQLVVTRDHKRLWMSEYGKADPSGQELARNLMRDFNQLHPTAWCYWQPTDSGGWGLLNGSPSKAHIRGVGLNAYILAQYSRHLRPGMCLLDSGAPNTVAAYDPPQHKLVLITFNDGPARTITYDLAAFSIADAPVFSVLTEFQGPSRYEINHAYAVQRNRLVIEFPAHSLQTFEIERVVKL